MSDNQLKIYLVTEGIYSDYRVLGVYSTKDKAEEAHRLYASDNDIEEYELDAVPPHPPGEMRWYVQVFDNGNIAEVSPVAAGAEYVAIETYRIGWGAKDRRALYVWSRDKDHAIKIASEKRREMLVAGTWYDEP